MSPLSLFESAALRAHPPSPQRLRPASLDQSVHSSPGSSQSSLHHPSVYSVRGRANGSIVTHMNAYTKSPIERLPLECDDLSQDSNWKHDDLSISTALSNQFSDLDASQHSKRSIGRPRGLRLLGPPPGSPTRRLNPPGSPRRLSQPASPRRLSQPASPRRLGQPASPRSPRRLSSQPASPRRLSQAGSRPKRGSVTPRYSNQASPMGKRGKNKLKSAPSPFTQTKLARLLVQNGLTIDLCEEDTSGSNEAATVALRTTTATRTPSKVLHLKGTTNTSSHKKKGGRRNSLGSLAKISRPSSPSKNRRDLSESEDECGTVITPQAVVGWTRQAPFLSSSSQPAASPSKTKNLLGSSSHLFGASSDSLTMENYLYGASESKQKGKEPTDGDRKIPEVITEATPEAENESCCGDSVSTGPYQMDEADVVEPTYLFETSRERLDVDMFLSSVTDPEKDATEPDVKTRGVTRADTATTAETIATDEEFKSNDSVDTSPSAESKTETLTQEDKNAMQTVPLSVARALSARAIPSEYMSQAKSKRSLLIEHMKNLDERLEDVLGKLNGVALRLKETQAGPAVVYSSDDVSGDSDDTEFLLRRLRRTAPRRGGRRKRATPAKISQESSQHSKSSRLSNV